jgi:hypothetical protein
MSVPLDRLYHYLADIVNCNLVIYRWLPHGSRKLEDLSPTNNSLNLTDYTVRPSMICHDQEPLCFDYYTPEVLEKSIANVFRTINLESMTHPVELEFLVSHHIRAVAGAASVFEKTLLMHSELHSKEVEKYRKHNFIPVYFWSHAIIANDWFRYAQHDPQLSYTNFEFAKDFLIYNRAWSGTREYRLKFAELLINQNLLSTCSTTFAPIDHVHYSSHQFKNNNLKPVRSDLEKCIPPNTHNSASSADYNSNDYQQCGMEIVLETLFDDTRWYLTEKTLRPIACGKPFVLMGTAGSLEYLKRYGFETFGDLIDESYDNIENSIDRMNAVIAEMTRITLLDQHNKQQLWQKLHERAQHNKNVFFEKLPDIVLKEYRANVDQAMIEVEKSCTGKGYYDAKALFANDPVHYAKIDQDLMAMGCPANWREWTENWLAQRQSR